MILKLFVVILSGCILFSLRLSIPVFFSLRGILIFFRWGDEVVSCVFWVVVVVVVI